MKATRRRKHSRHFRSFLVLTIVSIVIAFVAFSPKRTAASSESEFQRNKYYTCIYVDYGDTLWEITGRYITAEYSDYYAYIDEVMQINNLHSANIKTGMKLCVPYYADEPVC